MRLISLSISLLIMTLGLSYCLQATDKISKKQATVKCDAFIADKNSEEYKKCIKEGSKSVAKRAVELKNKARETRQMLDGLNKDIKKNLEYDY